MGKIRIVVIEGPTASGKSALAMELAEAFGGEIISADSMQVYRRMDIGTAKPSLDDRKRVRHHLIDIVEPDEDYTAARYRTDAAAAIDEIMGRAKTPIVAGGTGLYIKALTEGLFEGPGEDARVREGLVAEAAERGADYLHQRLKAVDPESASKIHPNNVRRVIRALEVCLVTSRPMSEFHRGHGFTDRPYDALKVCLTMDRAELYAAIERRVDAMVSSGLAEEARALNGRGYGWGLKSMCGLGYKEMGRYLRGESTLAGAVDALKKNTRHYAKRQLTWFRKDVDAKWFYPGVKSDIMALVKGHLNI